MSGRFGRSAWGRRAAVALVCAGGLFTAGCGDEGADADGTSIVNDVGDSAGDAADKAGDVKDDAGDVKDDAEDSVQR